MNETISYETTLFVSFANTLAIMPIDLANQTDVEHRDTLM